jgi:hypothetical protein
MDIELVIEVTELRGTLNNSAAGRDFASLLPLTLTLADFHGTEKINLPRPLSTEGAPAGTAASAGDITYYAPWGNLALLPRLPVLRRPRAAGSPRPRSSRRPRRSRRPHHRHHPRRRLTGGTPVHRTHETNQWRVL